VARPRTGSLEEREDSFYVRLTVDTEIPGETDRQWFCLNTRDRTAAELLRDQLNANASPARSTSPHAAQTIKERGEPWLKARKARGVAQWDSERGWLANHIYPEIGDLPIGTVGPDGCMKVINAVMAKKLSPGTIEHIRSTMHLIFDEAWRFGVIPENPMLKVKVPPIPYVEKDRVILTDDELLVFWVCDDTGLEIRMLSLTARCEGGMRTRDCTAWDWTDIDRKDFAWCVVPRTKTGKPQKLEIPEVLRGPLRAWWAKQGSPTSGPVFPVTRGKRKGEARLTRGVSFAGRLRCALMLAGVKRHECAHPDVRPTEKAPCCPEFSADPLYNPTRWSLPVDFHSFRRAFSTALADAGINTQQAMKLAGHADPRAHARYIMEKEKPRLIPEAALPQLGRGGSATGSATASGVPGGILNDFRAGHEVRTRDPQLGKLMLYQLS
jgi:integrase